MKTKQVYGGYPARWLVVDDTAPVLKLLTHLLESLGRAEIVPYTSAPAALVAFLAAPESFELVITDLEMPQMDGIAFSRSLHARMPRVKVLLATGSGLVTPDEARDLGFCGLLAKPFSPEDINRALAGAGILTHAAERRPAPLFFEPVAELTAA